MGGGDLNMKKHFHPLTMENLERVWKAEERKRVEDERIEELQQELEAERQKELFEMQAINAGFKKRKGEKLDWMYQGQQTVDTDAYLLGKKIDKNIDIGKEEPKGLSSGHVPASKTSLPKANDVLAKIKEDPLFLIKKKEEENKKTLLANPIKLRKMKELIEKQTSSQNHGKRHKKSKKKYQSSSSSEDSTDEEERKAKRRREKRHHSRSPSPSCSYRQKDKYKERLGNSVSREYKTKTDNRKSSYDQNYHEQKSGRENGRYHQRDTEKKEVKERYYNDRTKSRHDSSSSSDEDDKLEAQRNAMMSNAKWRQEQRSKNTKKYHREREAEEKDVASMLKKSSTNEEKADFVRKMQKDSLSSKEASVEDRIHRNIHSKQRTNASLNKKFTSR